MRHNLRLPIAAAFSAAALFSCSNNQSIQETELLNAKGSLSRYINNSYREAVDFMRCPAMQSIKFESVLQENSKELFSSAKELYNSNNALIMSVLSGLAYADFPKEIGEVTQIIKSFGFEKITQFSNTLTSMQGYIVSSATDIVIIFRGTDDLYNILTDFHVEKSDFAWGKVHTGFKHMLDPDYANILKELVPHGFDLTKPIDAVHSNLKKIWLSGHSLGAGLSMLFSARLQLDEAKKAGVDLSAKYSDSTCTDANDANCKLNCETNTGKFNSSIGGIYAFGAPPLGNETLVRCYNANFSNKNFRHNYGVDPVPGLQHWFTDDLGYRQTNNLVQYNTDSTAILGSSAMEHEDTTYRYSFKNVFHHRLINYIQSASYLAWVICD